MRPGFGFLAVFEQLKKNWSLLTEEVQKICKNQKKKETKFSLNAKNDCFIRNACFHINDKKFLIVPILLLVVYKLSGDNVV